MLLAAGAAGVLSASPAAAQQGELRGAVTEADTNSYLLRDGRTTGSTGQGAAATQSPAYQPASPGALPDDPVDGDPLSPTVTEIADPFAGSPEPAQRQPSTARQRAEQARSAAAGQPEDTAPAAVDDDITGTVRASTIDSEFDPTLDSGAERALPIEGLEGTQEDDPFAATGIRFGTFVLKPTIEQGITATDNADSSANGSGAILSETILRLNAVSDWSSHRASVDAFGTFRKSISGDDVDDLAGGIDAELELDLGLDYKARAGLSYDIRPESAASPVVIVGAATQPIRQIISGSLGFEKDVGKARFAINGIVERDLYGDADLEGGGTLSQEERNSTLYLGELRLGYEISPSLTPFVAGEIGRRVYDLEVDSAGYDRSSDRVGARAGLAFDRGEKLSGEFSVGWLRESFDDDRLTPIEGPYAQANIAWSPERGTTVNLFGQTIVEGTTSAGESGSILYLGTLSIDREIRSNLTGNAVFGAAWRDYTGTDGHDLILNAEGSLTWWLNRYAGLTGRVRHETVTSNLPDRDSETNSVFLGLKVQR